MNKNLGIALVLIIMVIAGYVLFTQNRGEAGTPATTPTESQLVNEASEFARAIQSGQPTTCTLSKENATIKYQLKGNLMRVESELESSNNFMISDGSYYYTWMAGQSQGIKMAIPTERELTAMQEQSKEYESLAPALSSEADYNSMAEAGYTINCIPSDFSPDIFTPPQDINFVDTGSLIEDLANPAAGEKLDLDQIQQLQDQYSGTTNN